MATGWQNGQTPVGWDTTEKREDQNAATDQSTHHYQHHHPPLGALVTRRARLVWPPKISCPQKAEVISSTSPYNHWKKGGGSSPYDHGMDDEYQDWWFAGTAIPLLAATIGPLANVFSIAALVTYWRMCLVRGVNGLSDAAQCVYDGNADTLLHSLYGHPFKDPSWCIHLNIGSLVNALSVHRPSVCSTYCANRLRASLGTSSSSVILLAAYDTS